MNSRRINVLELPVAANVCNQQLREVHRNMKWSLAHVTMNPSATSLLHMHRDTDEVYVITRGRGLLTLGNKKIEVQPGSTLHVRKEQHHLLRNTGMTSLEHLVLAFPPFDPDDVHAVNASGVFIESDQDAKQHRLPPMTDSFDGARIISYPGWGLSASIAFGWVINYPKRQKESHWHSKTTECIYIVEGQCFVEIDGMINPAKAGECFIIPPQTRHTIRSNSDQYAVVVCICSPPFSENDVHW